MFDHRRLTAAAGAFALTVMILAIAILPVSPMEDLA